MTGVQTCALPICITATQQVSAPVNRLFRFRELLTPTTVGSLRAPNADTLYLSGWFDLRQGPIVIRAPDTAGRYYTLAITDFDGEVQHVGRRTTGTAARDFVLLGPSFSGEVPAGLTPVRVATHDAWVLGRVLVRECIATARALGYRRMVLWTNSVLTSARRVYERAGFTLETEESRHSFGHDLVGQEWGRAL